MKSDLPYRIALSMVPHIGAVQAKLLIQHAGEAKNIFKTPKTLLEKIEGIGPVRAHAIHAFTNFAAVEKEIKFIEKYSIQPLFLTDSNYPQRLLNCYDSPTLLYCKGNASLNHPKIIGIIGTRNNTEYGKIITEQILRDLASIEPLIISGLAFGIDGIAHKSAMRNGMSTIGVLAHGLSYIYPAEHHALAREMTLQGALVTEFRHLVKADKHNFPIRNRIVAGMCDAIIVTETGEKGGSMITAELANGYNRDVFAVPGKTTDTRSAGCNKLIRSNKAILLTDGRQLMENMGWLPKDNGNAKAQQGARQRQLFFQLSEQEKKIVELLSQKQNMHIDELNICSRMNGSALAAAILNLEMMGIVGSSPGKIYTLL